MNHLQEYVSIVSVIPYYQLILFSIPAATIFYFIPARFKTESLVGMSLLYLSGKSNPYNILWMVVFFYALFQITTNRMVCQGCLFGFVCGLLTLSPVIFKKFIVWNEFYVVGLGHTILRVIHVFVEKKSLKNNISFLEYLNYLLFFPIFNNGPLERIETFSRRCVVWKDVKVSIFRISLGVLKLLVSAHFFGKRDYSHFHSSATPSFELWVLLYCITLWFFFWFSGYMDVVIGVSRLFGYRVRENFPKNPLLQDSPILFWRNWHATLMQWLRDYIYIPLGGNRSNKYRNILIAFFVGGTWHILLTLHDVNFHAFRYRLVFLATWGIYCGLGVLIAHLIKDVIRKKEGEYDFCWLNNKIVVWVRRFVVFNYFAFGLPLLVGFRTDVDPADVYLRLFNFGF